MSVGDIRRGMAAAGAGLFCALLLLLFPAAAGARVAAVDTTDTIPSISEPSAPATTAPDVTPPVDTTTPPVDTTVQPDTAPPDDALVGAGDPDGEINVAVATIAVVGFAVLLAIASWWMVRRWNPDAQPMPPSQDQHKPSDLI